jgi:prepilin-type N-terminal cleavage/methylation domain-containing protein
MRRGFTLLELIVVIAIIGVLLGLLVPAIQRIREAAGKSESINNLRQITLSVQQFCSEHAELLPKANGDLPNKNKSLFWAILPYIQGSNPWPLPECVRPFLSPSDPTISGEAFDKFLTSYAANSQVFVNDIPTNQYITDGLSCTICFTEHYAYWCGNTIFSYIGINPSQNGPRRATFADGIDFNSDGYSPQAGIFLTFQTAPKVSKCMSVLAQTPHPGGMLAALADGSVRTLAPTMQPTTYWAAVTPAGNETLGGEW